jgi:phosphocarrier protein HPr
MIVELTIRVQNSEGFHLRPITKLAQLALSFEGEITLHYNGSSASAKSPTEMLILAVPCGGEIRFEIKGERAQEYVEKIISLFVPEPRTEW